MLIPAEQPRANGRFVSVRGIDAPARTIRYREVYQKIWMEETKADPERLKRFRATAKRALYAWRRRMREKEKEAERLRALLGRHFDESYLEEPAISGSTLGPVKFGSVPAQPKFQFKESE